MLTWEYLINGEGKHGWEAVGMTTLESGQMAVLLKRPVEDPGP